MTFKICSNCHQMLTPGNCTVKVSKMGLWFHHNTCHGDSFMSVRYVEAMATQSADGDPLRALEAEYYTERLKEINNAH